MNGGWMQLIGTALESGANIYSSSKNYQSAQLGHDAQLAAIELEKARLAAEDDSALIIIAATLITLALILLIIKKKS